ncbi:MAG TPA: transglycosylase SLT domain-containing protein [Gammaproteobacteria bacterium]|nr:transglycosylase SLT domain-containing protein [Gammaproteobacteria bacterium]
MSFGGRQLVFVGLLLAAALPAWGDNAATPDPKLRQLLIEAVNDAPSFEDKFHAQVWLMMMSKRLERYIENPQQRLKLLKLVHLEATRAGLPPELVLAVIDVESDFKRFAVSYAGAQGVMQIMPFWLEEIGRPNDNLFNLQTNLRMGCTILKYYIDMENGDMRAGLARYNGSTGKRWYPDLVFKALSTRWYRE